MPLKRSATNYNFKYRYPHERSPVIEIDGDVGIDFVASAESKRMNEEREEEYRKMIGMNEVEDTLEARVRNKFNPIS
jgi:hypothetical protein